MKITSSRFAFLFPLCAVKLYYGEGRFQNGENMKGRIHERMALAAPTFPLTTPHPLCNPLFHPPHSNLSLPSPTHFSNLHLQQKPIQTLFLSRLNNHPNPIPILPEKHHLRPIYEPQHCHNY